MPTTHDAKEVIRTLELFCSGRVTEVRAFDERGVTYSGYFDDWTAATAAIGRLPKCKAVYFMSTSGPG